MTKIKHVHRHYIAAPLCALMFAASFIQITPTEAAPGVQEVEAKEEDIEKHFVLINKVNGTLFQGGEVDLEAPELALEKGSVLLSGKGLINIKVGSYDVTGLRGAFHVSRNEDAITIATITSPVLIEKDDSVVIIPERKQWSHSGDISKFTLEKDMWLGDRKFTVLPDRFLSQQLNLIAKHHKSEPYQAGEEFKLSIQERVLMAAELDEESDLLVPLLTELVKDQTFWALASVHPDYRDVVWILPEPKADRELALERVHILPQTDTATEAIRPFTYERWKIAVGDTLSRTENYSQAISNLIEITAPYVQLADENRYPERANRMRTSLQEISEKASSDLTEGAVKVLAEIAADGKVDLFEVVVEEDTIEEVSEQETEESKETKESEEIVEYSPEEVEARATKMLNAIQDFLYTVHTKLEAISPTRAEVMDIIITGPNGDRVVDFVLNVTDGSVEIVSIEGLHKDTFPFVPKLPQFVSWVMKMEW